MEEANKKETNKVTEFIDKNAEVLVAGVYIFAVVGIVSACIHAGAKQNKLDDEFRKKALDAEVEIQKYNADKWVEKETKITSDIKDIIHDVTTLKCDEENQ